MSYMGTAVYQVSARFPGPTTPRDFVTLLIMPRPTENKRGKPRQPRQFLVVSRPCDHPGCPPRSGFIRGQYESVEVIREVPVEKPLRRTRSSIDLSRDDVEKLVNVAGDRMSKEAVLRAAKRAVGEEAESEGEPDTKGSFPGSPAKASGDGDGDVVMAVEWLMVTRSDPGGSVPRFMVEKGTPGGIVNDAGKFLKWFSSQSIEDLTARSADDGGEKETKPTGESPAAEQPGQLPASTSAQDHLPDGDTTHQEQNPPSSGLYGLFTSALGAASSAVASRVAAFAPAYVTNGSGVSDNDSDTSSEAEFESADEGSPEPGLADHNSINDSAAMDAASTQSAHSTFSETDPHSLSRQATPISRTHTQHEKELRKLQQRMAKAQEKLERAQARRRAKNGSNHNGAAAATTTDEDAAREREKDDQALAKLREKHEREMAKQQEKYQRELKRLEEKRAAEERKAEERRRKAAEREERANVQMELERTRAERDLALKQVEMLKERLGELQAQNTMLVAKLGREGVKV